jgi:hypothetical protein
MAESGVGIQDICNYAIALMGTAVGKAAFMDTYDGDTSDPDAQEVMEIMHRIYPRARNYGQIKLAPQECLAYRDPGGALSSPTLQTNSGWTYMFSWPTNPPCLSFLGVVLNDQRDALSGEDIPVPYAPIGNQIGCDYDEDILFKYVQRLDDTTQFSESLIIVIAHWLAYLGARPCGLTRDDRAELLNEFHVALGEARELIQPQIYRKPPSLTIDNAHYRKVPGRRFYRDSEGNLCVAG